MGENGNGFAEGYAVGRDTNGNGVAYYPAPYYGGGYGGNSGFGFGSDWLAIIVLFALFGMGGFGGMGMGGFGGMGMFPWLLAGQTNTDNNVNSGFNNAALSSKLDEIQSGINNNAINSLQTAYNNQIASMNQNFAMQQAFDNCCCENRLGVADLKATVIQENCNDREVINNGIRDIITAQTAGTQRVLDQLCQDKIDAKNEKIADLERQITLANLAASQTAQTARLIADNNQQTVDLIQRIAPYPTPSYIVSNPYGCNGVGYNNGFYGNAFGNGFNGGFAI